MYKDIELNFPKLEADILKFWRENDVFRKSVAARTSSERWTFYEGPPTANGLPHPGHVFTRAIKDLFCRYKTMRGYYVPRKAGWDTHGLPVEIEVEKELGLNGKGDIEKYGVEAFIKKCIGSISKYTSEWEKLTERIGYWVDLKDAYATYHQSYVESVWFSLQEMFKEGQLYRGHKVLPWCAHCQTALSSHEVGQGYKMVQDPSVFVRFQLGDTHNAFLIAWTTTPWTLPCNSGLAVKADAEYVHVTLDGNETLIMAKDLVDKVIGKTLKYSVVKTEMGSDLVGRRYDPLVSWFNLLDDVKAKCFKVVAADFVSLDAGSGIVHLAPAFGTDDYEAAQKNDLPILKFVDPSGRYSNGPFDGRPVKECESEFIKSLGKQVLKRESYTHEYPFCWRCNNPLIYYARDCWFIDTTSSTRSAHAQVLENNQKTAWYPAHIRDGRFGDFLRNPVDWALSRERYWGTPLNIWTCKCRYEEAVGSYAELKEKTGVTGLSVFDEAKKKDPSLDENLRVHKPWIDAVGYDCPVCGDQMKRTPEVVDCWYDSGAMPFAQWGYPHKEGSKEQFRQAFPADFISEAIDQTRGWFYSLMTENVMLMKQFGRVSLPVPFKTCLVLGHVCDEKGEKMAKAKKNYLSPDLILDAEGADALRWFFYSSNNPWTNIRFSQQAVRDSQKDFLIKLRNVYSFFTIYANIDGFKVGEKKFTDAWFAAAKDKTIASSCRTPLDNWIHSELELTVEKVRKCMDGYDVYGATQALSAFVEGLSNWYVRRSRQRFWAAWETADFSSQSDRHKLGAYYTLNGILASTAEMIAPFVPFFAEKLHRSLHFPPLREDLMGIESVHLVNYPEPDKEWIDMPLVKEMALIRAVCGLGHSVRAATKIKTRQPLSKVMIFIPEAQKETILKHKAVLMDELNVKDVEILTESSSEMAAAIDYEIKLNFKTAGAKFRSLAQSVAKRLSTVNTVDAMKMLRATGKILLPNSPEVGDGIQLERHDVEVALKPKEGYQASGNDEIVVILETKLTPELIEEGIVRDLVSEINRWRSWMKMPYQHHINLTIAAQKDVDDAIQHFMDYLKRETLTDEVLLQPVKEATPLYLTNHLSIDKREIILGLDLLK